MGVCYSCLRGLTGEEDHVNESISEANERTPFIQDYSHYQSFKSDSERQNNAKRQQALQEIVGFTGENLIDVTSVAQPEVHSIGKSAAEYRELLSQLTHVENSPTVNGSVDRGSFDLFPKDSNITLTDEERDWLSQLVCDASKAMKSEPVIKLTEPLVHTFEL